MYRSMRIVMYMLWLAVPCTIISLVVAVKSMGVTNDIADTIFIVCVCLIVIPFIVFCISIIVDFIRELLNKWLISV